MNRGEATEKWHCLARYYTVWDNISLLVSVGLSVPAAITSTVLYRTCLQHWALCRITFRHSLTVPKFAHHSPYVKVSLFIPALNCSQYVVSLILYSCCSLCVLSFTATHKYPNHNNNCLRTGTAAPHRLYLSQGV